MIKLTSGYCVKIHRDVMFYKNTYLKMAMSGILRIIIGTLQKRIHGEWGDKVFCRIDSTKNSYRPINVNLSSMWIGIGDNKKMDFFHSIINVKPTITIEKFLNQDIRKQKLKKLEKYGYKRNFTKWWHSII